MFMHWLGQLLRDSESWAFPFVVQPPFPRLCLLELYRGGFRKESVCLLSVSPQDLGERPAGHVSAFWGCLPGLPPWTARTEQAKSTIVTA